MAIFPKYPFEEQSPMMGQTMNPFVQGQPGAYSYSPPQLDEEAKKIALKQALFAAGMSLLANQKPTALPQSPMANIGQAGLAGLQQYNAFEKEQFDRGKELMASKAAGQKNLSFDTFTDKAGKTWRIGYNPLTGEEVSRIAQGEGRDDSEKKFKYTGASVFRGEDGNWWRWNPTSGDAEHLAKTAEGYRWINDPKKPVPDAVVKELGRPPASSMEKGVTLDLIKGSTERIKQNYNPEWIGPFAGRAYRVQESVTGLRDDSQSVFYADVNDLGDMLLRARSGAQINEAEYARLLKLVPTPNLPPKVFSERLDRFEKQFTQALQSWESRLRAGRYVPPGKAGKPNAAPQGKSKFTLIPEGE